MNLPSLFISHGTPDLIYSHPKLCRPLAELAKALPVPKGIVIMSAHWQHPTLAITVNPSYSTLYDFYGFSGEINRHQYPARNSQDLQKGVEKVLSEAGYNYCKVSRGLDHGAWSPLSILYPEASIPVITMSLPSQATPEYLMRLGQKLGILRNQGCLLIGSGSATHNLGALSFNKKTAEWAKTFMTWLRQKLTTGNTEALLGYREALPESLVAHPSDEHFLPLFFALGAGGSEVKITNDLFIYSNLNLATISFGDSLLI